MFEVVTDKRELPDVLRRAGDRTTCPTGISAFRRPQAGVRQGAGRLHSEVHATASFRRCGRACRAARRSEIEDEVRRLIDNGYKEIVITGIHVGHYGVDTTRGKSGLPPFRLWHLFRRLDRIPGDWRMRLSSIEAAEINDDFISAAADCEHLCPQFHPALQSGSDTVLRRMRRRYSVERFLEKLDRDARTAADIPPSRPTSSSAFPARPRRSFEETLDACRPAGFMKIHIFPFSPRRGTPAATIPGQVHGEVRNRRQERLSALEAKLAARYHERLVGTEAEVLVEGFSPVRAGWVQGTDRRYVTVEFPGSAADFNQFVQVRGTLAQEFCLVGERY